MSRPALRLVDADTGELLDVGDLPELAQLRDKLAGAERDINAWRMRYAELARDKQAEAIANKLWPVAIRVFEAWKQQCNHPRARWTADRFWLMEPLLVKYSEQECLRAIAGAAYDPFVTTRKNGTTKRHDALELIFRDAGRLEDFANRAPLGQEAPAPVAP
jgi:hypothetical protein